MPHRNAIETVATIGIDIGKNSFHLIGLDGRGEIVMQTKLSRLQLARRLAYMPPSLIGMEACSGSHHLGRIHDGPERRLHRAAAYIDAATQFDHA